MTHAAESTHWYDRDGKPCYTIVGKNGKERNTTLRDAREHGYVPSVTSIIRCAAAPSLEIWKQNQVLMAALTLPRKPDEPEADWLTRVIQDSKEQGRKAAERGTAIHASVQSAYEGRNFLQEHFDHVRATQIAVAEWMKGPWDAERSFSHSLGYGGKCDLSSPWAVVDFKTKEFKEDDKLKTWDEHAMQLAAYRYGLDCPHAKCAIVYVSASVPGLARLIEIPDDELEKGWEMFQGLLSYWQAKSGYVSAFEEKMAA